MLSLEVNHALLSCPDLLLVLRDGVRRGDPLLYQSDQARSSAGLPTRLVSSRNSARFELKAGGGKQGSLMECYAELKFEVSVAGVAWVLFEPVIPI